MAVKQIPLIIAGHICLDIIPTFPHHAPLNNVPSADSPQNETSPAKTSPAKTSQIEPGRLYEMGEAVCATGGVVSNTGLALHKLGTPALLMGKVGNDLFGGEVLNILQNFAPGLAEGMLVSKNEATSYTIVINPPNQDRSFLHCPGANDTLCQDDFDLSQIADTKIFHFGYPPLMKRFLQNDGCQMRSLFDCVQKQNVLTSLDMAMPDPNSASGKIDWRRWLENVLPSVDLFLPSLEEILFMLDRKTFDQMSLSNTSATGFQIDIKTIQNLANQLLDMGAKLALIKLGDQGLYLKTSDRLSHPSSDRETNSLWKNCELLMPSFKVNVVGATGAGDCTIAGFLSSMLQPIAPETTLQRAAAVGACNVEAADSTSGIPHWNVVLQRIQNGWSQRDVVIPLQGWAWSDSQKCWTPDCDNAQLQ